MKSPPDRAKIFGIGLGKTGTTSLTEALRLLGWRATHYPDDSRTLRELAEGRYRLSILEHHDALLDVPVPALYPQLDRAYPGSRFILTVRDLPSWLESSRRHAARALPIAFDGQAYQLNFQTFSRVATYGVLDYNEERYRYVYETHSRNVRHYFRDRPQDLLILDVCGGEGWDRLCPFLQVPVPAASFPQQNVGDIVEHWAKQSRGLIEQLGRLVPATSSVIVVDRNQLGSALDRWQRKRPFLERDGVYWGAPPNDETAVAELERLREEGAEWLAVAFPAFWWLDHYEGFARHIRARYPCILDDASLLLFDLRR
jgi:hypothetical protein